MHTNGMIYRMNLGLKSNFYCRGARELGAATLATTGIFLIYSELDIFLFQIPEIGIIMVATLLLWFAGITFDTLWAVLGIGMELLWFFIRGKTRRKCKTINRIPLVVITWLYLAFSLVLSSVYVQQSIYQKKSLIPDIALWLAASAAHRLFKSAGGRKIPLD